MDPDSGQVRNPKTREHEGFLDREWAAQATLLKTGYAKDWFRRFLERQTPEFTGK